MNPLIDDKIRINYDNISYMIQNPTGVVVYFSEAKPAYITHEDAEFVLSLVNERENIQPMLFKFSEFVHLNKDKINYIKNNFEAETPTKWKVTAYVSGNSEGLFRVFPLDKKEEAIEFFERLLY